MLQAFIIVLREGFEAFLIVSVILAYLKRTGGARLLPWAYWGIGASIAVSGAMGLWMSRGVNEPLWEGALGFVAAVMVTTLVIQMWRQGRYMKQNIEKKVEDLSAKPASAAGWGVFLFTLFMIAREGMETVLMLIQVPQHAVIAGAGLGVLAAAAFALLWVRLSRFINLKAFFQVTGLFLLLFVIQILIYSVHEFSETGLIPNSEGFHAASEPYGPEGIYGRWYPIVMVGVCALWLVVAWLKNVSSRSKKIS